MKVAIDGSRCRSGGAIAHLLGFLSEEIPREVVEVHVWVTGKLKHHKFTDDRVTIHVSFFDHWPVIFQLFWQGWILPFLLRKYLINKVVSLDAGTLLKFPKLISISQDMLSFEEGAIDKYFWGRKRLRLELLRYLQVRSLSYPNYAIYLTNYAKSTLLRYTQNEKRSFVIPHGIDDFEKPSTTYNTLIDGAKLIYISNVAEYKNQGNVLIAVKRLFDAGFKVEIMFVGGGQDHSYEEFLRLRNTLDSDETFSKVLPFVNRDALPELIAQNNIFLFASSCENMPITLLEGMVSRLPIICSHRGPMPEILKDGGFYFDPENIDSTCEAIENLLKIKDLDLIQQKVNRASQLASEYTWQKTSKAIWNLVQKI